MAATLAAAPAQNRAADALAKSAMKRVERRSQREGDLPVRVRLQGRSLTI